MKCQVFTCKHNNNTECLNIENVIIYPCEDGFYCQGFEESLESKLNTVHISKEVVLGKEEIILRNTSAEVFMYHMKEIIEEIERLFGYKPEYVYFDTTLRNGIRNSSRFAKSYLDENGNCIEYKSIDSGTELYEELKVLSCNFLRADSNRLNYPIILSTQRKLLSKGVNL